MATSPSLELEVEQLSKRFGPVVANDRVDLRVERGEVHAIVGENGAGKTTLMSMLYGLLQPDSGSILLRGEPARFHSPLDAISSGMGMVHQAFKLFPTLSVAENVVYRSEPSRWGVIDRSGSVEAVRELAARHGLDVDPNKPIEELSIGVMQRVEILKALYRDASILILDEPTAVLTPQEKDKLFDVIRRLRDDGRTVLFITHKIGEVMEISDHVTVLRQGRSVAHLTTADTTAGEIVRHMTGRSVDLATRATTIEPGTPVLRVDHLAVAGHHGVTAVEDASFEVRSHEIVGVAGVAGNGQTELVEAIAGLRPSSGGSVTLGSTDLSRAGVAARRESGLAYIPEDRHAVGTSRDGSVQSNLLLGHHREPEYQQRGWFKQSAVASFATDLIERFGIRVESASTPAGTLSGGNLQKVVVAREMAYDADLLIAEQPTRGVDIGAIEFIHERLISYRDAGGAVLLVSAELTELLALSSRILVMFDGRIVADLDPASTDEFEIGAYMTGTQAGVMR